MDVYDLHDYLYIYMYIVCASTTRRGTYHNSKNVIYATRRRKM